jgi:two-component system, NtrC family, sensor histidine kinase HydH
VKLGVRASAFEQNLAGRLAWITGLRLAFLSLFLVATAFFYLRGDFSPASSALQVVFGTIAVAFGLAAAYAALLRTGKRLHELADAQLVIDQIAWTAIVYVTGGATSGATSFYALTALTGAILSGLRGAAIAAVMGIGIYTLLCAAFWLRWIHPPADSPSTYIVDGSGLIYPLLVNVLGIVVVALLGGYLAERLRITGGALEEATERAAMAERLAELGRLSAGLAHEIRNPLGSISGSVEMLRESLSLSDEDKLLCAIISREASRLNNLVTDMIDLSRPRLPIPVPVDVATLAQEVVALASRSDRSAEDVSVIYTGPLTRVGARCDPAQIRQVLWNLVRNAVQVSAAGSRVTVHIEAGKAEVRVTVSDEGPGIAPEEQDKIFDAFYTKRTHGTGIGLAVVKRIVDDHGPMGARISVESVEGSGARFTVALRADVDAATGPLGARAAV